MLSTNHPLFAFPLLSSLSLSPETSSTEDNIYQPQGDKKLSVFIVRGLLRSRDFLKTELEKSGQRLHKLAAGVN